MICPRAELSGEINKRFFEAQGFDIISVPFMYFWCLFKDKEVCNIAFKIDGFSIKLLIAIIRLLQI